MKVIITLSAPHPKHARTEVQMLRRRDTSGIGGRPAATKGSRWSQWPFNHFPGLFSLRVLVTRVDQSDRRFLGFDQLRSNIHELKKSGWCRVDYESLIYNHPLVAWKSTIQMKISQNMEPLKIECSSRYSSSAVLSTNRRLEHGVSSFCFLDSYYCLKTADTWSQGKTITTRNTCCFAPRPLATSAICA